MYGKILKLAQLSHFFGDFGPLRKMFLALKFEPLDQMRQNFQFGKHKKFLASDEKGNSMQYHLGFRKWQNHGANFT